MADPAAPPSPADDLFTRLYPDLERLARYIHRRLREQDAEEAVQETLAFTLAGFRTLAGRGVDPEPILPQVVRFAAKRYYDGRRFAGKVPVRDALSRRCREGGGRSVTSLAHGDDGVAPEVRDALRHRVPGPAEEAACRLDWQTFLDGLPHDGYRDLAEGLAAGRDLTEIARERGVSKSAVQQMAARLRGRYDEFDGTRGR